MVGSVDVPEKLGTRTVLGLFDLYQLMRVILYILVIILLAIFITPYLAVFTITAIVLVWVKIENQDLDLYIYRFFTYTLNKKVYFDHELHKFIYLTDIKNEIVCTASMFSVIIETTGINLSFYSEKLQKRMYQEYIKILNSMHYDFEIRVITTQFTYLENLAPISSVFESAIKEYQKLIQNLTKNRFVHLYYIILHLNVSELSNNYSYLQKYTIARTVLNRRAAQLITSFSVLNIKCRILKGAEIVEFYRRLANTEVIEAR